MKTRADYINEIIRGYRLRSDAKEARADANLAAARADEEFAALERRLNSLYVEKAKLDAGYTVTGEKPRGTARTGAGKGVKGGDITTEIKRNEAAVREYLKKRNLSAEIAYDCPACRDTGRVAGGKLCACVERALYERAAADAGARLPEKGMDGADENFFPEAERAGKRAMYNLLRDYCKKFPDVERRNILLTGGTGTGKTHLAMCAAGEIARRGETVLFVSAHAFNNGMLRYHLAPLEQKDEILFPFLNAALLVIDDLGSEPMLNNVTREYLCLVLDERLRSSAAGTIVTTNLTRLEDLRARYGDRVLSRLADKRAAFIAEMKGADMRIRG